MKDHYSVQYLQTLPQTVINRTIAASNMVVLPGVGRTLFSKSKGDARWSITLFSGDAPWCPKIMEESGEQCTVVVFN